MENVSFDYQNLIDQYPQFISSDLQGRYVAFSHIEKLIETARQDFEVVEIGKSTLKTPIHSITVGTGKIKILVWSQMHGNESTTTKAVFDVLNFFRLIINDPLISLLKMKITLKIVPMLNPDGAEAYTRVNANKIDLNRDALNLQELESRILREEFDEFKPNFCFNLHDQRTIFSAGKARFPATISFLTPAMNEDRDILPSREVSMKVIAHIAEDLKELIPNQIGRYDDAYNKNCTGDTFQKQGVPTILFEAGHYPGDYHREKTRKFITAAIISALRTIASGTWKNKNVKDYFNIPENEKLYYDLILRNTTIKNKVSDIAIQFQEQLKNNKIVFVPVVQKLEPSLPFYGHKEIDCKGGEIKTHNNNEISENVIVDKIRLKNELLTINYQNI
jgi:hypothetical protein